MCVCVCARFSILGDGTVDFNEFSGWFQRLLQSDEMVEEIFSQVDTDGSGSLDKEEIGVLLAELGNPLEPDELTRVMAEIDVDGNNDVDVTIFGLPDRKNL